MAELLQAKKRAPSPKTRKRTTAKTKDRKATREAPGEKRLSVLDAPAEVLRDASKPVNCKALVTAMAEEGLWFCPARKALHATVYAATPRQIGKKGGVARFKTADRGLFAFNAEA